MIDDGQEIKSTFMFIFTFTKEKNTFATKRLRRLIFILL